MQKKLFFITLMLHLISWSATPALDLEGVVDFYFEGNHAPSSKTGQTGFEFSRLEIIPRLDFQPQLRFEMRFDLAEERDTSSGYQSKLENAFFSWVPHEDSGETHQLGLIRPEWREQEGLIADFDNFGDSSKNLARRYNFISDGDLGYQFIKLKQEEMTLTYGFINGEANQTAEIGPSKEAFIGIFKGQELSRWGLWLSYGRVDNTDDKFSERSRVLARWQQPLGRIRLGLEVLFAQDASTDIESQARAEGMTFTELTNARAISTQAYRVELYYQLSPIEQFLLRHDNLTTEIKEKSLESSTLAWIRTEPELFDWGLFYENTLYGEAHSSRSRQIERMRFGVSKTF
jgi:hypothetical protein